MKPPAGFTVYEGELTTFWFDEEGILCGRSKPVARTLEKIKAGFEFTAALTKNQRVCLLLDTTDIPLTIELHINGYIAEKLRQHFKAIAFIARSPEGTLNNNLYVS